MDDLKQKDNNFWKDKLSPEQYQVMREKGTERPYSDEYEEFWEKGEYVCAACGETLFDSDTKFNAYCGWPSFYKSKSPEAVDRIEDRSHGMVRTEVTCKRCGSHLGHVFNDGPPPSGERFCINSVALKFVGK